ncbi:hypothetical protein SAMN04487974_104146 [Pelagibacterium luteolum]|uniref:Uncharacterized protein n=1 Tax=Pelagibacterium luteolum TaxID=440168 RepID=A0A1G7VHN1_9HYPH|nr:hypothetical protein SAMN04487974_104146 [Pelagibacterium luteolum]
MMPIALPPTTIPCVASASAGSLGPSAASAAIPDQVLTSLPPSQTIIPGEDPGPSILRARSSCTKAAPRRRHVHSNQHARAYWVPARGRDDDGGLAAAPQSSATFRTPKPSPSGSTRGPIRARRLPSADRNPPTPPISPTVIPCAFVPSLPPSQTVIPGEDPGPSILRARSSCTKAAPRRRHVHSNHHVRAYWVLAQGRDDDGGLARVAFTHPSRSGRRVAHAPTSLHGTARPCIKQLFTHPFVATSKPSARRSPPAPHALQPSPSGLTRGPMRRRHSRSACGAPSTLHTPILVSPEGRCP